MKNFYISIIVLIGILVCTNTFMVWQIKIEQLSRTERVYQTPVIVEQLVKSTAEIKKSIESNFSEREREHDEQVLLLQSLFEQCH